MLRSQPKTWILIEHFAFLLIQVHITLSIYSNEPHGLSLIIENGLKCKNILLIMQELRDLSLSSTSISSSLHSHVTLNLKWGDNSKLSNLLRPRNSGTIKSLQLLSTSTWVFSTNRRSRSPNRASIAPRSSCKLRLRSRYLSHTLWDRSTKTQGWIHQRRGQVWSLGFRVQDSGFRAQGLRFRASKARLHRPAQLLFRVYRNHLQ